MFIGSSVPAYSRSPRKNLLSTPRFFVFFDLGIRHAAAGLVPDRNVVRTDPERFFEQWVGVELWKRLQYRNEGRLHHFRSKDGAEVDFVVEREERVIPIEVKWTESRTLGAARRLPVAKRRAGVSELARRLASRSRAQAA